MIMTVYAIDAPRSGAGVDRGEFSGLVLGAAGLWRQRRADGRQPAGLGYGLRHAVDADHIAAIDNVTRKMMQQGRRPFAVGAWFSLGHSSIVAAGLGGDSRDRHRLQHADELAA